MILLSSKNAQRSVTKTTLVDRLRLWTLLVTRRLWNQAVRLTSKALVD